MIKRFIFVLLAAFFLSSCTAERQDEHLFCKKLGFDLDSDGKIRITAYLTSSGKDTPEKDGARLCEDVKKVYSMPGGKEKYWDQVPLEVFIKNYAVSVRPCEFKDIIEIDTFNELKAIDKSYC